MATCWYSNRCYFNAFFTSQQPCKVGTTSICMLQKWLNNLLKITLLGRSEADIQTLAAQSPHSYAQSLYFLGIFLITYVDYSNVKLSENSLQTIQFYPYK